MTNTIKTISMFNPYLLKIEDKKIRDIATIGVGLLPEHFWTQSSSSTGRHHPKDEHGKGGLARHTLRVMRIADILISTVPPKPISDYFHADAVRLAAMFHDAGRYGFDTKPTEHPLDNHPKLGADFVIAMAAPKAGPKSKASTLTFACHAIEAHMGQWGPKRIVCMEDWMVHYADIIAAQYSP